MKTHLCASIADLSAVAALGIVEKTLRRLTLKDDSSPKHMLSPAEYAAAILASVKMEEFVPNHDSEPYLHEAIDIAGCTEEVFNRLITLLLLRICSGN